MILEIDRQNRLYIEPIDGENSYILYLNERESRTFQIENVIEINSDFIERKLADILIISHYLKEEDDVRYLVFTVKDSELIQLEDDDKHIYDLDIFSLSDRYLYLILKMSRQNRIVGDSFLTLESGLESRRRENLEDSLVKFDKNLKSIQTLFTSELKIEKPITFKGKTIPFLILSSRRDEKIHHIYSIDRDEIICRNIPTYEGCRFLLEHLMNYIEPQQENQVVLHDVAQRE